MVDLNKLPRFRHHPHKLFPTGALPANIPHFDELDRRSPSGLYN